MVQNPNNQLYGFPVPQTTVFPAPILSAVAPTTANFRYPIGQVWIDTVTEIYYGLVNVTANSATWTVLASVSGPMMTLTADSGGPLAPSAGNINILGTANEITTAGSGSTITLTIPSAFIAPGSIVSTTTIASGTTLTAGSSLAVTTSATVGTTLGVTGLTTLAALTQVGTTLINASGAAVTTIGTGGTGAVHIGNATGNTAVTGSLTASTTLTATLGAITATNGNLVLVAAGNKILRSSVATTTTAGANSMGSVTLVGGTATIATSAVTASSLITIWRQSVGSTGAAALGQLSVGTISAGVNFAINAWSATDATALQTSDVSVIGWEITN